MPAPNTPQDIIDRIRDLERQIRDLSGRVNIRPALNTIVGGSVTIKEGGSLLVQDFSGTNVLSIGRIAPDVDGEAQMATVIRRMDGSLAFAVWTASTTGSQPVRIYDKNSNIIFADDSVAGGMAIPYLAFPVPLPTTTALWGLTASTTFATIARSVGYLHHPRLFVDAVGFNDTGATGYALQILVNGDVLVTNATNTNINGFYSIPGWDYTGQPQYYTVELQMKRVSGTGNVKGYVRGLFGMQS